MRTTYYSHVRTLALTAGLATFLLTACKPSDVLGVPAPIGFVSSTALNSPSGAEQAFLSARESFYAVTGGGSSDLISWSGLLADEFTWTYFGNAAYQANIDARQTAAFSSFQENGDNVLSGLLLARASLLLVTGPLNQYVASAQRSQIGETLALVGYAELLMAEDYCSGVPLSHAAVGGGVVYSPPVTTDSLLEAAVAHFDSAMTSANGNDTITALASVGLGRALTDMGQYAAAATAVQNVSSSFTYNIVGETNGNTDYSPTLYESEINPAYYSCAQVNVSDREGTNGLNFVSAADPRLILDSTLVESCDGQASGLPDTVFYYPVKFGNPSMYVPLATGIEASLIQAEAALPQNGGSVAHWLNLLNALRNSGHTVVGTDTIYTLGAGQVPGQTAGLPNLTDPGSDSARLSLTFRERAFWLFGTGSRLSDLRRLVRQYGRSTENVFPTGPYAPGNNPAIAALLPSPLTTYGTDVSFTLPTPASGETTANPYYQGCLTPTTQA